MTQRQLSRMQIRQIAEDRYHVLVKDEFTDIDELVGAPKLMAILGKERLVGTTAVDVLTDLEAQEDIGYELLVIYRRRISA